MKIKCVDKVERNFNIKNGVSEFDRRNILECSECGKQIPFHSNQKIAAAKEHTCADRSHGWAV